MVLFAIVVQAFSSETSNNIATVIDIIGIIAGAVLLVIIASTLRSFTGSLRKSYDFMICLGILFQILALVDSLVFIRIKLFTVPNGVDIHHLLMIIGFVFFGIAVYRLRIMVESINKKG